uniref:Uncharacterized protein n=1 Tax=Acrobeloides nanus TaxID=290746 RepID=A0A914CNS2_9BILA
MKDDEEEDKKTDEQSSSSLSNLKEVNNESTHTVKTKSLLSFDQDEGDDVADFKLKKNTQKDSDKALFKKHKRLVKEYEERKADIKKEVTEQEDVIVLKNTNALKPERNKSPVEEKPRFRVPEKPNQEIIEEISIQEEVRQKFSSTFDNIPDAKDIYEARKRRERMRREGDSGIIPVDDTIRMRPSKGERSRLIREDENDLSDEDEEEGGKFYSSKSLLIVEEERRRAEQEEFLRIEQGDDDDDTDGEAAKSDDDELARWEHEQIRKGVVQLQSEYNLTSLHNRGYPYPGVAPTNGYESYSAEPQPMDMDVEIVEESAKHSFAQNLPTSSAAVSMESVLLKLKSRIM